MKISGFNGVNNATDDTVLAISYTTDGGSSYQTKKIRMADMIDDFSFDDLADTSIGTLSEGDMLRWDGTSWVTVSGFSGSFATTGSETVTVVNGLITSVS